MPCSSFVLVLALAVLLVGKAAVAQAPLSPREEKKRQVRLEPSAAASPEGIRVAPGTLTVLAFDTATVVEVVELEGKSRFRRFVVGPNALLLEPAVELLPSERLALEVAFKGGLPSATFFLVAAAAEVDREVEVVREEPPAQACQAQLTATLERCEARQKQLEQLQAHCEGLDLATVALAPGLENGPEVHTVKWHNPGDLTANQLVWAFRLRDRAALKVDVRNRSREPWVPARAEFVAADGARLEVRVIRLLQPTIVPDTAGFVAIEVEVPGAGNSPGPKRRYSMRLCDAQEERCLSGSGVVL